MLSRQVRLRSGRDFRAVYSRCRSFSTPKLVLSLRQWKQGRSGPSATETPYVRFGFSISKKTAKRAHDRNKIKRRLREIVRILIIPRVRSGMDCDSILTVRQPALALSFAELAREVEGVFRNSGLLLDES